MPQEPLPLPLALPPAPLPPPAARRDLHDTPSALNAGLAVAAAVALLCTLLACLRLYNLCAAHRRRELERRAEQRFALAAAMSEETCEARL
jgi:hypothetical protein